MIKLKIFNSATCAELLGYRGNASLRSLYDGSSFDFPSVEYLAETVNLDATDCELGTSPSDDFNSSVKIFNSLRDLDLVQANDKRLWTTLTHTYFFGYTKKRWAVSTNSSDDVIKDRFHFEGAALRQRNQNSIARLWWAAKITFDPNREDPFELTRLLWEKQDFYQNLVDRKYSVYKGTLIGFLNFYAKNKHLDIKLGMRKLFKGINAFGGVRILSLLDESEIEAELYKLCEFYKLNTASK